MQMIIASQDVRVVLVDRAGGLADGLQAVVGDEDHDGADGDAVEGDAVEGELELADGDDHGDGGHHDVDRLVEVDLVLNPDADADHADHAVQQERNFYYENHETGAELDESACAIASRWSRV